VRCPLIRNALKNGWVKMRSRGRIAKFVCNKGFELIGSQINTCIRGKWNNPMPICTGLVNLNLYYLQFQTHKQLSNLMRMPNINN
jgi:hypothetical protein